MFYPKIDLLLQQGRHAEAEAAIREDLRDSMDDPMLFVLLCIALRAQDKLRESEDAARQAISIEPELDVAWWSLAQTQLERTERKAALKSVEKAISIDPYDADYFAIKARILSEMNREQDGLEAAEAGLAIEPDNESCRFFRSILLANLGRHDEAASESEGLLADGPEDAAHHAARGWVKAQRGDGRGAEQNFIEALRIDPESEDARAGLAFAMKLSNPLLGAFMRLLILVERIPILPFLVGIFVVARLCENLADSGYPPPIPQLGILVRMLLMIFFVLLLTMGPLFDLALYISRRTRHALTTEKVQAVKWCLVPMGLGFLFLALWIVVGWFSRDGHSIPYYAIAWFSVARLISEAFDADNDWVRRRMHALAVLGVGVAIWVLCAGAFLAPKWKRQVVLEVKAKIEEAKQVSALPSEADADAGEETKPKAEPSLREEEGLIDAALAENPDGKEVTPEQVKLKAEIKTLIIGLLKKISRAIHYPVLGLWIVAAFADNIGNWLTRRAPR